MEQTIDLEIPLLLPGIENEKDECLATTMGFQDQWFVP